MQEESKVKITTADLIYMQVQELSKRMDRMDARMETTRKELNERMDKLDARMDKLEGRLEKQNEKIEKLADKIDGLRQDLRGSASNISVANISTIGIALGVLYFVATH